MDPDYAWEVLTSWDYTVVDRLAHGRALLDWLQRDGFVPTVLAATRGRREDAINDVKLWINSLEARDR